MNDRVEEQIRLGLRLVAEEVEPPVASRRPTRPSRRVAVFAIGLAVLVAGVVVLGTLGGSPTPTPAPGARFIRDAFDYRPASLTPAGLGARSTPGLIYAIPTLSDVAASSGRDAWIVGSDARRSALFRQGVAWRWDGTAWRDVPMPTIAGDVDLRSVATATDGQAWAVGYHSARPDQLHLRVLHSTDYRFGHALVEHWDGTRWGVVRLPRIGISTLLSVSASGPQDVWAVGMSFGRDARGKFIESLVRPLVLHWDGSSWSVIEAPWTERLGFDTKVVTTGGHDVWVYDAGRIEHWDGSQWQLIPAPFGPRDPLSGFTATSASDAWAVGSYRSSRGAGGSQTLTAHWNGRTWQIAPTPDISTGAELTDVVAVHPNDVWAVGESASLVGGPAARLGPFALFEHWDGRSWTTMPRVKPPRGGSGWDWVLSIAAAKDGTAWAVGGCYFDNAIAGWNGSTWTIVSHPPDKHWDSHTTRRQRKLLPPLDSYPTCGR